MALSRKPSSFHNKKRPDQFKIDSTSENFKGVCTEAFDVYKVW